MSNKEMVQIDQGKLSWCLFALRLGIFIVLAMWSLDKFVNPAHAAAVFSKFYNIDGLGFTASYILGSLQVLLVLLFLVGFKKRVTYGLVLLIHLASTLVSFPAYMNGVNSLLFFAAWPMLAACITLYVLRDADTRLCLK